MERHTEVRRWLVQEQTNKLTRYPRKEAKQSETGHHANSKQKVFMTRICQIDQSSLALLCLCPA